MGVLGAAALMGGLSAAGSLGAGVLGFLGSKKNADVSASNAKNNLQFQREQFEYQKQLNELTMKREDTAIQRGVRDAMAAGLSPLGQSGASSASMNSGTFAGVNENAGTTDYSSLVNGVGGAFQNALSAYGKIRELDMANQHQSNENAATNADIAFKMAQTDAANAQTALLQGQSEAVSLDNAFKSATLSDRVDTIMYQTRQAEKIIGEIESRKDLNTETKNKLIEEVKQYKIQNQSYADFLSENLSALRLSNDNMRYKNDISKIDRIMKNNDLWFQQVERQLRWDKDNQTLLGKLAGDFRRQTLQVMQLFNQEGSDSSWFWENQKK